MLLSNKKFQCKYYIGYIYILGAVQLIFVDRFLTQLFGVRSLFDAIIPSSPEHFGEQHTDGQNQSGFHLWQFGLTV